MVKNCLIVFVVLFCLTTSAQEIKLNTEGAQVEFIFIEKGTKGTFDKVNIFIELDKNNLSTAKISGEAEVSSFRTDNPDRDKSMKSENHMNAEQFPKIKFEGKEIVQKEDGLSVIGILTIKDVSKETTFDFSIKEKEIFFESLINASDFGVGIKKEKELNGVQVTIRIPL